MASQQSAPYRLTLLGPWDLRGPDGQTVRSVLSQPKRLCLLAYLVLSGGAVSRSTLVALFWPESDEERARNALSQSLHYLRRSLGPGIVQSVEGDRIRVAPEGIWMDARELLDAEPESAPSADPGPKAWSPELLASARRIVEGRDFFQGYNADDNGPLQEWLDGVRREVRAQSEAAVALRDREASTGTEAPEGAEAREEADAPEGAEAREEADARIWIRRWTLVGGGTLLGIILGLLALRGVGDSTPTPALGAEPPEVAILLPRVTILTDDPGYSPEALAQAVHDELAVLLGGTEGLRTVFIAFESEVWQLVRSLEAQGTDQVPDLILSVSIRSADAQARVVGLLLRGPDYTEAQATHAQDYELEAGPQVLMGLPRQIAADVVNGIATGFPPGAVPARPPTGAGGR